MKIEQSDNRFDRLFDSLVKFDADMDKFRRVKGFLCSAIKEAWRSSAQINLRNHVEVVVRMPIGSMNPMRIEVCFHEDAKKSASQFANFYPSDWVRMSLIGGSGHEIRESEITLIGLEFLMSNPSPMIDAAAKFCDELGCLEVFKGKVGRFCLMEYKI